MIQINFTFRQPSQNIAVLRLPLWFRYFFSAIALFIGYVSLEERNPQQSIIGPLIIIISCLLAASYQEAWLFNREKKKIERRFGLLFFYTTRSEPMEELDHILILAPPTEKHGVEDLPDKKKTKWKRRQYAKLFLVFKDRRTSTIEMLPAKQSQVILKNAERLSLFCGCPVRQTNPYETA